MHSNIQRDEEGGILHQQRGVWVLVIAQSILNVMWVWIEQNMCWTGLQYPTCGW